jgi:hypothetical protein
MRFGSKLTALLHMQLLRMLLLQMTPGLQMQEHLFLIVYFLTQQLLLNLSTLVSDATLFIYG